MYPGQQPPYPPPRGAPMYAPPGMVPMAYPGTAQMPPQPMVYRPPPPVVVAPPVMMVPPPTASYYPPPPAYPQGYAPQPMGAYPVQNMPMGFRPNPYCKKCHGTGWKKHGKMCKKCLKGHHH